jgi:hypothetical protein
VRRVLLAQARGPEEFGQQLLHEQRAAAAVQHAGSPETLCRCSSKDFRYSTSCGYPRRFSHSGITLTDDVRKSFHMWHNACLFTLSLSVTHFDCGLFLGSLSALFLFHICISKSLNQSSLHNGYADIDLLENGSSRNLYSKNVSWHLSMQYCLWDCYVLKNCAPQYSPYMFVLETFPHKFVLGRVLTLHPLISPSMVSCQLSPPNLYSRMFRPINLFSYPSGNFPQPFPCSFPPGIFPQ